MFLLHIIVDRDAGKAERRGHREDDDGEQVFPVADGVAAQRRRDDGRDAPERADDDQLRQVDVGQAGEIAEQVFRRAGHHEDQPEQEQPPRGIVQETQLVQLFVCKEDPDDAAAEPADEQQHDDAADPFRDQAHQRALHCAERVAGRQFQRFSGDERREDLDDGQQAVDQPSVRMMRQEPFSRKVRILRHTL